MSDLNNVQQGANQQGEVIVEDSNMSFLDEQPINTGTQQDNSGALYPNTQRRKESHPNCRGRSLIKGTWFWVSGWNNLMPSGTSRYISLSYTEMTQEDINKYIINAGGNSNGNSISNNNINNSGADNTGSNNSNASTDNEAPTVKSIEKDGEKDPVF